MREFLIHANDGDFLVLGEPMEAAFHPPGYDCERIDGWGDYRMRCEGVEVAANFEAPGVHLVMEAADDRAGVMESLADAIAAQVANVTGRSTYVVLL